MTGLGDSSRHLLSACSMRQEDEHRCLVTGFQPVSLQAIVKAHGWWQCQPYRWREAEDALDVAARRWSGAVGEPLVFSISQGEGGSLLVYCPDAPSLNDACAATAVICNLAWDLSGFYHRCRGDETLGDLEAMGAGRVMRGLDLFEDLAKAISFTNIRWSQAVVCINRLVRGSGTPIPGEDLWVFPTAGQILDFGLAGLTGCGLGYRAAWVMDLARQVADDPMLLSRAPVLDGRALRRFFTGFLGIGPVTARYLAAMYGHFDELAVDSAVLAHVRQTHPDAGDTPGDAAAWYHRYAPFDALAWMMEWALAQGRLG